MTASSPIFQFCVIYSTESFVFWKHLLGWPRTSDFSRCNYHAAQMKHMVLYGCARTGDYLIVAIRKSRRVQFPGWHDCRWTAACTNETHRNKWEHALGQLLPPSLCVKPALSKAISLQKGDTNPLWCSKRYTNVKYWFWKLKNVLLSMTVLLKDTVIKVSKPDCGEKCARQLFLSGANWMEQRNVEK